MDRQLQQRLLGAAIVVAVTVIFVPELVRQPQQTASQPANSEANQTTVITMAKPSPATPPAATAPTSATSSESASRAAPGATVKHEASAAAPAAASTMTGEPPRPVAPAATGVPQRQEGQSDGHRSVQQPAEKQQVPQRQPVERRKAEQRRLKQHRQAAQHRAEQQPTRRQLDQSGANDRGSRTSKAAPSAAPAAKTAGLPPIHLIGEPMTDYKQQVARRDTRPLASQQARARSGAQVEQPRWMVQVGSFAEIKHAEKLRDRLQAHHFAAILTPVRVDGKTLYRVRIGPHSSRARGERTRERLQRQLGINGALVPVYQ